MFLHGRVKFSSEIIATMRNIEFLTVGLSVIVLILVVFLLHLALALLLALVVLLLLTTNKRSFNILHKLNNYP